MGGLFHGGGGHWTMCRVATVGGSAEVFLERRTG